jgi:ectoine hydroxylase-related dioxygenase (phytanoyl-CoA dioxygenase family)
LATCRRLQIGLSGPSIIDQMRITEDGYWIEENVVSHGECDALVAAIADTSRSRAGARHLMGNPAVAQLAADPRLVGMAQSALGEGAVPYRATLFEKSGKANWLVAWHQDTALPLASSFDATGWGPWSEKEGVRYAHAPTWALSRVIALRLHIDASTSENGPLRIIPGSHAAGVLSDERVLTYVRTRDQIECTVPKGGVLAMRPLLIHASSKAQTSNPRRVLHIEYADSLVLAPGIRLALA